MQSFGITFLVGHDIAALDESDTLAMLSRCGRTPKFNLKKKAMLIPTVSGSPLSNKGHQFDKGK